MPDAHVQGMGRRRRQGRRLRRRAYFHHHDPTLGVRGRTRLASGGARGPGAGAARAYHDKEPGEPGNGEVERKMNLSRGAIWRPPMAVFLAVPGWARVRQWLWRSGPYPCLRAVMPIAACRRHAFIEGNACEINPQSHPAQFDAGLVGRVVAMHGPGGLAASYAEVIDGTYENCSLVQSGDRIAASFTVRFQAASGNIGNSLYFMSRGLAVFFSMKRQ